MDAEHFQEYPMDPKQYQDCPLDVGYEVSRMMVISLSEESLSDLCFSVTETSFPTPMEEPKKVIRCHYLGTIKVAKPTGKFWNSFSHVLMLFWLPFHLKGFWSTIIMFLLQYI
jgi:hypothetical protein